MSNEKTNCLDNPVPFIDCDAWCTTKCVEWPSVPFSFVWTIENIKYLNFGGPEPSDSLFSTQFDIPIPNSAKLCTSWRLKLNLQGWNDGVFYSLHLDNCSGFDVKASYKFSILDVNKERQNVFDSKGVQSFKPSSDASTSGTRTFVENGALTGDLLPNDCLHILCELTVTGGGQLNIEGKKIANVKETDTNINDSENQLSFDLQDALLATLSFTYTGKIPSKISNKLYKDLIVSAKQHQLEYLKDVCDENLCKTVDVDSCIGLLIFADTHSATLLKKRSLEMAAKNLGVLMKTSEWKEDLFDYPLLRDEIIENALALKELLVVGEDEDVDDKKRSAFS